MIRAILAVAVASAALAPPATITPLPSRVEAFAQDGGRVAWIGGSCSQVHVRVLATGHETLVGENLDGECQRYPARVVLGGSRVLWTNQWAGNFDYVEVSTGAPGKRQHAVAGEYAWFGIGAGDGTRVVALAGDGPSLVYAVLSVGLVDNGCMTGSGACTYALRSGFVAKLVGRDAHRLWQIPAAIELAVARDTLAIVRPLAGVHEHPTLPPERAVELWSLRTRTRLARIELDAAPAEVAVDRTTVAVLVHRGGRPWLERFAVPSGRRLGSAPLAAGAMDLSLSSSGAVYRTGRTIRLAGRARPLAIASAVPVGLSIESTRVAWAENTKAGGRIRTLKLR